MNTEVTKTLAIEEQFNDALKLRDAGDLLGALHSFKQLAQQYPDNAPVYGVMGDILWDFGNLEEAIACFKTVVKLSPRSELGSLGLFHTLWEAGHTEEALQEMNRYLAIAESAEYETLLRNMNNALNNSDKENTRGA